MAAHRLVADHLCVQDVFIKHLLCVRMMLKRMWIGFPEILIFMPFLCVGKSCFSFLLSLLLPLEFDHGVQSNDNSGFMGWEEFVSLLNSVNVQN